MQLKSTNNLAVTEDHYLNVVAAKTAALFSAAAESGALLCGRGDGFVAGLKSYGMNLGIAFQLVDDALDYSGRQALMGKSVGDDFREAKMTLPIILAHARADETARAFWKRVARACRRSVTDRVAAGLALWMGCVSGTGGPSEILIFRRVSTRSASFGMYASVVSPSPQIAAVTGRRISKGVEDARWRVGCWPKNEKAARKAALFIRSAAQCRTSLT